MREFSTQLLRHFSKSDNISNHHLRGESDWELQYWSTFAEHFLSISWCPEDVKPFWLTIGCFRGPGFTKEKGTCRPIDFKASHELIRESWPVACWALGEFDFSQINSVTRWDKETRPSRLSCTQTVGDKKYFLACVTEHDHVLATKIANMCVLCVFLVCQIARLHQAAVPMSLPRELPTCEACVCVNMPMCQPVCHLCACQALTRGRGAQHCFWQSLFVHLLEIIIDLPIGFPINNIISLLFGMNMFAKKKLHEYEHTHMNRH